MMTPTQLEWLVRTASISAKRLIRLIGTALLVACASAQAASVRASTLPGIQPPPITTQPAAIVAPDSRIPAIQTRSPTAPTGPSSFGKRKITGPSIAASKKPGGPAFALADTGLARLSDPALKKELARLQRVAKPKSGYGTTNAAADAAWTLGLIELHGGVAPRSPAQAQTWFEHASRFGRQPMAWAGVAWCHIDGCSGPPDPSAARQAIARLRPHYRARALFLEWLLSTRVQPLAVRLAGPEGVSSLRLPMRDVLERAAAGGDSQARVELGIEAVTNGDIEGARRYFKAAAGRSRAATANLRLLDEQVAKQPAAAMSEADDLLNRARRAHRGVAGPANYAEALRLYQAAAAQGSAGARRMLALITSRRLPDGTINLAWMSQLAWLDTSNTLPRLEGHSLSNLMYRDPTPLFDLLPQSWQRALTTVPN